MFSFDLFSAYFVQWKVLQQEVAAGVASAVDAQVNWDGLVQIRWSDYIEKDSSSNSSNSSSKVVDVSPVYPGNRSVYAYEQRVLDESTVKEYFYESLLFGWCLIGACSRAVVMGEEAVPTATTTTANT